MCKWLFQNKTDTSFNHKSGPSQDELNFMLSQLSGARDLIDNSRKRSEQGIAFCLTLWTALLAAVISITSSNNFNQDAYLLVLGVALIAGSIPGFIAFGAFISAITASGISRGKYLIIREYFINSYPNTRRYLDYRSRDDLLGSWKDNFRRSVMVFLHFFALGVSIMWSGGLTLLCLHFSGFPKSQNTLIVPISIGVISELVYFTLLEFFIFRHRRKVKADFVQRFALQNHND